VRCELNCGFVYLFIDDVPSIVFLYMTSEPMLSLLYYFHKLGASERHGFRSQ
jgi:hypothetical protein